MGPLIEKMISAGLISREQALAAAAEAVKVNRSVWAVLVALDYISEEHIMRFFAQEAQIPYVHLPDYSLKRDALETLDEHFCRAHTVIPLCRVKDTLFVACSNPFNAALMDTIGKLSRCSVEPLIATSTAIFQALDYYWHAPLIDYEIADYLVRQEPVKGMAFWRESERIPVDWPVELMIKDESLSLSVPPCVEGRARDISRDGSAIGISFALYLPRGIKVIVALPPRAATAAGQGRLELSGEIVHSFMQNTRQFCVGIRLADMGDDKKQELLRRTGSSGGNET